MSLYMSDIYIMHSDTDFYKAYCGDVVVAEITKIQNTYATQFIIHYKHPLDELDPKIVDDLDIARTTIWSEMDAFIEPKLDAIRDFIKYNS